MTDPRDLMRKYLEQRDALEKGPVVLEQRRRAVGEQENQVSSDSAASSPATPDELPQKGLVIPPPSTDLFTEDSGKAWIDLLQIADAVRGCEQCRLCESRTNTVPGEGPSDAKLVVVGEGPGAREDETGRPFVGRAGELLTDILRAIKLERDSVFICNIVKCRPPSNRTPRQEEIEACVPYLYKQLEIVGPKVILAMGSTAITTLLQRKQSLGAFRGKVHSFRGVPLIATYHPAALLRNPNWKRPTWDDVRIARRLLDE